MPRDACHVGRYGGTYAWVTAGGREGLARFTMTVLELATGKPHAPTRTVVRTYKGDGTLDSTQVTTTEVDTAALDRIKTRVERPDRRPIVGGPGPVSPGLLFVPR